MLCPKCQHRNPDANRFCGQCGGELTRPEKTIYPREGYDEAEFPAVSDVDLGIPRLRRKAPALASSEYGPAASRPYLSQTAEDTGSHSLASSTERDKAEAAQESRVGTSNPAPALSQGIHGPSFLGLADPPDPDFLSDIEEPSHARRNWLLFALALVAVLAFAEWRNMRSSGFNLNLAGTMKLVLPHKKGEPPKPPGTGSADTHSENGPANNGQPIMEVNPVNGAGNQNSTQPPDSASDAGTGAAQQGTAPSATPATPSNSNSDQPSTPSAKGDKTSSQDSPPASSSQANSSSQTNPSQTSSDSDSETHHASNNSTANALQPHSARATKPKIASPPAGQEELVRAESAGSPETAAKWLWAATSKGNLDAPVRLADMYAAGRGVRKDCEQAAVLLRSSARRGNPRAAARLGMYYATGRCVDLDRAQAWHWLSIAQKGEPGSDWINQYRQRLWSEMTSSERARAGNGPTARASE